MPSPKKEKGERKKSMFLNALRNVRYFSSVPLEKSLVPFIKSTDTVMTRQHIFVPGQLPIDPSTGKIVQADVEGQAKRALENIEKILRSTGNSWNDVTETRIFLKNPEDSKKILELIYRYFNSKKPETFVVPVTRLPREALIEIAFTATRKQL